MCRTTDTRGQLRPAQNCTVAPSGNHALGWPALPAELRPAPPSSSRRRLLRGGRWPRFFGPILGKLAWDKGLGRSVDTNCCLRPSGFQPEPVASPNVERALCPEGNGWDKRAGEPARLTDASKASIASGTGFSRRGHELCCSLRANRCIRCRGSQLECGNSVATDANRFQICQYD